MRYERITIMKIANLVLSALLFASLGGCFKKNDAQDKQTETHAPAEEKSAEAAPAEEAKEATASEEAPASEEKTGE